MIDEREGDPEQTLGTARPDGHATFEEPTGSEAVIARPEATITDVPELVPAEETEKE